MPKPHFIRGHALESRVVELLKAGTSLKAVSEITGFAVSMIGRYRAACLRHEPTGRDVTISPALGVTPAPAISAAAAARASNIAAKTVLALREARISVKSARAAKLNQITQERAADMSCCEACRRPRSAHPWEETREGTNDKGKKTQTRVGCDEYRAIPGGTTGLIIRKPRAGGLVEYAIDTSLLDALNVIEKDIAIEMGQWQEGHNSTQLQVQIVVPWTGEGERPAVRVSHADDPINTIEVTDMAVVQNPV